MKNSYPFFLSATVILMIAGSQLFAQWCEPLIQPYASTMPGITHFVLNSIDRASPALESATDNFTFTGLSTTLQKGQTYTVSITHTVDAPICPDMNIRVYIDYNLDSTFEDPGETVISTDHHAPGTYTATFTVPNTAITGTTRLRAAVKMSNLGGHTAPTPCNIPADPLGYHGEMEDYIINLVATTSVEDIASSISNLEVFPNPVRDNTSLTYEVNTPSPVTINVYNIQGQRIRTVPPHSVLPSGKQTTVIDCADLANGIYLVAVECSGEISYRKMVVEH